MGEHAPRTNEPDYYDVLSRNAVVRDASDGVERPAETWVEEHMAAEQRSREECVEALMNAIARGDVILSDAGAP
ncbi:MAG: hypothetical protein IAI50_21290 [Candidatus Eremiobacteraeota bacterium]|nr:hypothetical protein [Candidatus Eremiobacteraeota bacterium]